jgi:hypothetical protein
MNTLALDAAKTDDAVVRSQASAPAIPNPAPATPTPTPATPTPAPAPAPVSAAATVAAPAPPKATAPQIAQQGETGSIAEAPVTPEEAAFHRDLLRQMFTQVGMLGAATQAGTSPGVVSTVAAPAPAATNQINLNQYFGDQKLAGPPATHRLKCFSLFHPKEKARPMVGTLSLAGLSPTATIASPPPPAEQKPIPTPTTVPSAGNSPAPPTP